MEASMAEGTDRLKDGRYGEGGELEGAWCIPGRGTGELTFVHVYDTTEDEFDVEEGCMPLMYDVIAYSDRDCAWVVADGGDYYGYRSVRELCVDCLGFDPDGPEPAAAELGPDELDRIVYQDPGWEDALLAVMDRVPSLAHAGGDEVACSIPMGLFEDVYDHLSKAAGTRGRSARLVLEHPLAAIPKQGSLATSGGLDFWVDPAAGRMYATLDGTNALECEVAERSLGGPWTLLPEVPSRVTDALSRFASGRIASGAGRMDALAFRPQDLRLMGCDASGTFLRDEKARDTPVPQSLSFAHGLADIACSVLHSRIDGGHVAVDGVVHAGRVGVPVGMQVDLVAGYSVQGVSWLPPEVSGGRVWVTWPSEDRHAEVNGGGPRDLAGTLTDAIDQAGHLMPELAWLAVDLTGTRPMPLSHDHGLDVGDMPCLDSGDLVYFLAERYGQRGQLAVWLSGPRLSEEARRTPMATVTPSYEVLLNGKPVGRELPFRDAVDAAASAAGVPAAYASSLLCDPSEPLAIYEGCHAIVNSRTYLSVVPTSYTVRSLCRTRGTLSATDHVSPGDFDHAVRDAVSGVTLWVGKRCVADVNALAETASRAREPREAPERPQGPRL